MMPAEAPVARCDRWRCSPAADAAALVRAAPAAGVRCGAVAATREELLVGGLAVLADREHQRWRSRRAAADTADRRRLDSGACATISAASSFQSAGTSTVARKRTLPS